MAKIDLNTLSIEELAALRDEATDKLAEKVAARQAELEAELEKLSLYGKPAKKPQAPTAKPRKDEPAKVGEKVDEPISKEPISKEHVSKEHVSKEHVSKAA